MVTTMWIRRTGARARVTMSRAGGCKMLVSATTGGRASSGLQETGVRNDINFAKQQQPVSYVDDLVVLEDAFEDVFNISSD